MKKISSYCLCAVVVDAVYLLAYFAGLGIGVVNMILFISDAGGVSAYFNEIIGVFASLGGGEQDMAYSIFVGPIILAIPLFTLYCLIAIVLDVIKIYKGLSLRNVVSCDDSAIKKSKFLMLTSILTFNVISVCFYAMVKSELEKERVMIIRQLQGQSMPNYPMNNYPMQNYPMQGQPMQNYPMQGQPMQNYPTQWGR